MTVPFIMLTAGGTGGHMFPAEALATELIMRGYSVGMMTDSRGRVFCIDMKVYTVLAAGLSGQNAIRRIASCALLAAGTLQAIFILWRKRPAIIVGFGGYAAIPALLAARILAIPTVLHEQNAVLGRSNRLLGRSARAIALSFAETNGCSGLTATLTHTGMPVRQDILKAATEAYIPPNDEEKIMLIVIGGSLGARIFADVIPAAIALLPVEIRQRLVITQQCRQEDLLRVRQAYDDAYVSVELATFFTDIAQRMRKAHLAITRAGASTLAEIVALGLPTLLVPFPTSANCHQSINAMVLEDAGAAWRIEQSHFVPSALAEFLEGILNNDKVLQQMAQVAHQLAKPDACVNLADLVVRTAMIEK